MYNPVPGSRISSKYKGGYRSSGGHDGIDFAAPRGSKAYAFFDGEVLSTGWGGAYGNLMKIRHSDGTVGYYAHLDKFLLKPGTKVRRGDVIGLVGSTGNSTGPHLHVSVYRDGVMQNPEGWLSGTGSYSKNGDGGGVGMPVDPQGEPYMGSTTSETVYNDPAAVLASIPQKAGGWETPSLDGGTTGNPMTLDNLLRREAAVYRPEIHGEHPGPEALPNVPGDFQRGGPVNMPFGGTEELSKLINAIATQESGNNYGARNRSSGAAGKYQIMPSNIPQWSKEALGYSISLSQFMRNPELQDRIAAYKLGQYHKKYGVAGAAQAWYAGEGSLRYSPTALNRKQGAYPSISGYVQQVLRKAGIGG